MCVCVHCPHCAQDEATAAHEDALKARAQVCELNADNAAMRDAIKGLEDLLRTRSRQLDEVTMKSAQQELRLDTMLGRTNTHTGAHTHTDTHTDAQTDDTQKDDTQKDDP